MGVPGTRTGLAGVGMEELNLPPPSFSGLGWGGREMINPSPDAWQCPPPSPHLWGNS